MLPIIIDTLARANLFTMKVMQTGSVVIAVESGCGVEGKLAVQGCASEVETM
jgi:hypothetical protein